MRNNIDLSLARFLMIVSMVLLGVLELLWLHNEYRNKYRDMEDKINHVMFSNMRDVEDSLIFSRLASGPFKVYTNNDQMTVNIMVDGKDSVHQSADCNVFEKRIVNADFNIKSHHPRGVLLQRLKMDSAFIDSTGTTLGTMVMQHIRASDSTGEFAGYDMISWQGADTMIKGIMSQPQMDVLVGKKMALSNKIIKRT